MTIVKTIIWTRSRRDWSQDKVLFQGYKNVINIPLVKQEVIAPVMAPPANSLVIITSGKAAEIVLDDGDLKEKISKTQVYTFSEKVSQVLNGDYVTKLPLEDGQGLVDYLRGDPNLKSKPVYFLGAEVPAIPIVEILKQF